MLTQAEKLLDQKAVKYSRALRENEADLTAVLIDAARTEYYRRMDFPSLSAYIKVRLEIQSKYSYALAAVAKRAIKLKSLEKVLRNKSLTRCCATRLLSIITEENQDTVIEYALTHTYDEIEAYVAGVNCGKQFKESLKKLGDDHFRMSCDFDAEQAELLQRVQAIETRANRPSSLRNANVAAWKCYLKYNCKVEKAERAQNRKPRQNSVPQTGRRLVAATEHAVNHRDKGRCTFIKKDGSRCNERHLTEIHHIIRVADGGSNDIDNLTTLCWHHHDLIHQLELPLDDAEINFGVRFSHSYEFAGLN